MTKISLFALGLLFSCGLSAQWAAGVATIMPSNPYLGTDDEIRIFPIVTYEGDRLIWRGPSLTYKLTGLQRGEPSFALTLNLAPNKLDTDDSDRLDGIKDRDFSFMTGARYTHPFKLATFSLSVETDVSSKHDGQRAVLSVGRPLLTDPKRQWMINISAELEYLSANYADYYFAVDQQEANNSRYSKYQVGSVVQPAMSLGAYYQINQQWNVVANLRLQGLADDVKASPIVDASTAINGFMGLIYSF